MLDRGRARCTSPGRAMRATRGIATVFQDLATVPLMSVWRNFFLGDEPTRGRALQRARHQGGQRSCARRCRRWASTCATPIRPVGTLSGGERQAVAIARAVYFGAQGPDPRRADLGARRAAIRSRAEVHRPAHDLGRGVIFITHNPHHAYPVGDRFVLLKRGQMMGSHIKAETSLEQLTSMMAGGAELEQLSHELQGLSGRGRACGSGRQGAGRRSEGERLRPWPSKSSC